MLEKISHVVLLKDFYGPLLTPKQQNVLSLHYENDLSLSEIADNMQTSRQAVYDLAKRAESLLEEYEHKLGLVEKFQRTRYRLKDLALLLESAELDKNQHSKALAIIDELSGLL
ncbi:MAG: YlxM family DNA-binding protein [Firmicutes bacterium]|nr:YlxM family DNA-binding protein [Bacillota bacterium]